MKNQTKVCDICGTEFVMKPRSPRQKRCSEECQKEYMRRYNRTYRAANRETEIERIRLWKEANRDRYNEYQKDYYHGTLDGTDVKGVTADEWTIYQMVAPTGESYVGCTGLRLRYRLQKHRTNSHNEAIQQLWLDYPELDDWQIEAIETHPKDTVDRSYALDREAYWIEATKPSLNVQKNPEVSHVTA